ncbi:cell adhesion molecule Dscam2-like [Bacillus rossius redtenbacheri]|uniref:cell adhesion molecule Dscam2-like n=1 Tax=Bacillus rossius redtenbacheri TaxID=93214 RepID=UPI002FDCDC5A
MKKDKGMHQYMVCNREESTQSSGELVLGAVAPELLSTFIEQTLQPGPPVSLRCVASGNPPPRFTWQLDGADVPPRGYVLGSFLDPEGSVVGHLNVSSARVLHGGLYACVARNLLGAVHHSAALNVYGPPTPRLPRNLTAVAGADVFLRCPVAGFPISSVVWQRTGAVLPSHLRQKVLSNGTLLVRQVDGSSDKGEYLCTVTNQQGQSAQGRVYLDVMKPPKITPFQFSNELQKGMRTQASCSIMSGDFPISISWRKDGAPLPQEPDVQAQQHEFVSNLLFRNLAARHSGHYTCIASNPAATANHTAKLVVRVPPAWVAEPRDVSALFQQPASLHCQASGYPEPAISWMKARGDENGDYAPLEAGPDLVIHGNGTVFVPAIDSSHEGHYRCRADNGIGSPLAKTLFLRVNVPAHFRTHAVNQSGVAGQSAVLVCEAEGDRPLRVAWAAAHGALGAEALLSERPTPSGLAAELRLRRLDRASSGAYRCAASNDYGRDEMVVYLTVKGERYHRQRSGPAQPRGKTPASSPSTYTGECICAWSPSSQQPAMLLHLHAVLQLPT